MTSAARRPHWLFGRIMPRRRCATCRRRVSRARHMLGLTVCSGPCYAAKYQRGITPDELHSRLIRRSDGWDGHDH